MVGASSCFSAGSTQQIIQDIFLKKSNFILFICSYFVHYA